jgi:hypothetical protein
MKNLYSTSPVRNERGNAKVIVLGVVALAVIGVAVWYFFLRGGGGEGAKLSASYIPKDVQAIGSLDVAGLQKSAVYANFKPEIDKMSQDPKFKEVMDKAGMTTESIKTVALGFKDFGGASGQPNFVAVVKGDFDAEKLMGVAKEQMKEGATEKDLEGTKFIGTAQPDMGMAAGGSGIIVMGPSALVGESLKVNKGGAEGADKNDALQGMAGKIDRGATFWMVSAIPPEAKSAMAGIPEQFNQIAGATHVGFSVDVSSDLVVKAGIKLANADGAKAVCDQIMAVKGMAKMFTANAPADIKGDLDAALDSLTAEPDGDTAVVSAKLAKAGLDKLAAMAKDGGIGKML